MNKPFQVPDHVLREQYASSDPQVSAWVAANAGSGKTHVLTQRVIRLMLAGNTPDRILCLTFTKAAAANMKTRVFDTLAKWTMMDDAELDEAIQKTSGQRASPKSRERARRLFTKALDTPGGLKIQTIHAFCESLLHQFPLEANVPGHFETLQDLGQTALLEEAKSYVLSGRSDYSDISHHYRALVESASQDAIERGIHAVLSDRNVFLNWIDVGIDGALEPLYASLGVASGDTEETIQRACIHSLPVPHQTLLQISAVAGNSDKSTDQTIHAKLSLFLDSNSQVEQFEALSEACLAKNGELRNESRIVTAFVKREVPEAAEALISCGEAIIAAKEKMNAVELLRNSYHLFHIAEAVLERYAGLKRARGVIDFDDQVEKTAVLLSRTEIKDWIRYRLDRGIDHVLVDEAQDTSPKQWEIINAITGDFHTGESAATRNRTMFVVGDEKQSIYSFQGAKPDEFARQQAGLEKTVRAVQKAFHPGRLSLSFRSTSDVLHAVDMVFENEKNRRGLVQSGEQPVHDAVRKNDPGEVQVWPLFIKEKVPAQESWLDPVDKTSQSDPVVKLAERIADTIGEWVGKPLPGSGEPLKYEDILVLVRKRDRFITALTRTMKDKGLKVAGADRLTLTDHIAVEDLLAVGQFVLLPQDDLNLACVLKGVLFSVDEETLFDFAYDRGEASLYEVIVSASKADRHPKQEIAKTLVQQLNKLLQHAQELDVFDFFAWLLGPFGMRKAFLSRLGMEAEDVMDAFLDEIIAFTREGGIGIESFISTLKRAQPEIKREVELDRDEVRILTVHASKGLEAKIVFLVDPCNAPWTEKHRPPILPVEDGYLWLPSSDKHVSLTRASTEQIKSAAEEEYRRLLYVGMTRAADRLIVCGFRGANEPKHEYWHQMVEDALCDTAAEQVDSEGKATALIWRENPTPDEAFQNEVHKYDGLSPENAELPNWLTTPLPHEKPLPQPLTPTGAFAMIEKEITEDAHTSELKAVLGSSFALQKGQAVHKLLEVLPDIPSDKRAESGKSYLVKVGVEWTDAQRESAWSDVERILTSSEYEQLFSCPSSAEVSLTGKIKTRSGERLIVGQIDRLVIRQSTVAIVDYKTNHLIPHEIPRQYLTQMALYKELVSQIYPQHQIECYILWTHAPKLEAITNAMLETSLAEIKKI